MTIIYFVNRLNLLLIENKIFKYEKAKEEVNFVMRFV